MRNKLLTIFLAAVMPLCAANDDHTRFLDVTLAAPPDEVTRQLVERKARPVGSRELEGRLAGMEVLMTVGAGKDSLRCDYLRLTTQGVQGVTQRDDYHTLLEWMKRHYGQPHWEASVRSHRFARWFVGFDRDIVMIEKASQAVEVWFYENHERRDYDYYAILKYCERHPAQGVPHYTAEECKVWKSVTPPAPRKAARKAARHHAKKRRHRRH